MQQKYLYGLSTSGFHKLAYLEWGAASAAETIICVHGLTRNSHDFDFLAQELSKTARVICPDLPGRGASDWLANPKLYSQQQYIFDLVALIARLNINSVTWIGTSLGGILGMYLAAQANTPIKALVLNDVGPSISKSGLARIAKYTKGPAIFANLQDAEKYFRHSYMNCEMLTDEQWQYKTLQSITKLPDGRYSLAYDPNINKNMHRFWWHDISFWPWWKKVKCPVLTLRGENSDILTKQTAEQMRITGPKSEIQEIPGCGHAPMLMSPDQIGIISNWLANLMM